MVVMNHSETITKNFSSIRKALDFIQFLDADETLIQRNGDSWNVLYNATKTTITLTDEDYSEVNVVG